MIPFERSLSKLSKNLKIVEIEYTEFKLWQLKVLTFSFSEVRTLVRMIWLCACILTWLNSGSGRNTPLLLWVTLPSIASLSWRGGLGVCVCVCVCVCGGVEAFRI